MTGTTCDVDCIDHEAASMAREAAERLASPETLLMLRAFADPVRLRLLAAAADRPDLCACDLAWVVGRQKSLVSHHLKQLRDTGLLDARRDGRLIRFSATPAAEALLAATAATRSVAA
jgi:DNA-binding transcriptional ArsR family regulator